MLTASFLFFCCIFYCLSSYSSSLSSLSLLSSYHYRKGHSCPSYPSRFENLQVHQSNLYRTQATGMFCPRLKILHNYSRAIQFSLEQSLRIAGLSVLCPCIVQLSLLRLPTSSLQRSALLVAFSAFYWSTSVYMYIRKQAALRQAIRLYLLRYCNFLFFQSKESLCHRGFQRDTLFCSHSAFKFSVNDVQQHLTIGQYVF